MRKGFLTLALLVFGPSQALALEPWGEAGDWAIMIDPENGNGCLATRKIDTLTVEIGAVPDRSGGFFAAYNPEWTDIEDGATSTISFIFEDAEFAGDVVGATRNDTPGGYAFFDNPEFVKEFTKRHHVIVSGEGGTEIELDLSGSTKAVEAVEACQAEQPKATAE